MLGPIILVTNFLEGEMVPSCVRQKFLLCSAPESCKVNWWSFAGTERSEIGTGSLKAWGLVWLLKWRGRWENK